MFYKVAGKDIDFYDQNQSLLEDIADNLRKINSNSLVDYFDRRLKQTKSQVVINDDVRDTKNDFPYLKKAGFKLIRIECDEQLRIRRLQERNDLNMVVNSKTTQDIDSVEPDHVINTSTTTLEELKQNVYNYLESIC